MARRALLIVLDSLGVGELPDAKLFGDEGANTLGNIIRFLGRGLRIPNLEGLGLLAAAGLDDAAPSAGGYGKAAEASQSKDTMVGHWELMGLIMDKPFPTYPDGFPREIIEAVETAIGRKTMGNVAASGTAIIEELGETHMRTGMPIIYTSADSVFQVAAHEDVIPPRELYGICRVARGILRGQHLVGRVIARPFRGRPGRFVRTSGRKDFAAEPPGPTVLDAFIRHEREVWAIGKIDDIFSGRGISKSSHALGNREALMCCRRFLESGPAGSLGFANLVDFDMLYGHRNDAAGYAKALEEFDVELGVLLEMADHRDLIVVTADHGCDPTTESTDHSREYVPILFWSKAARPANLGTMPTFAVVGATIADALGVSWSGPGESVADKLFS